MALMMMKIHAAKGNHSRRNIGSFGWKNNIVSNMYVVKQKYTTANVVIYADILCFHLQYFFCSLNFVLWFIHFLSYFCSLYGYKKGIVLKYSIQPLIFLFIVPNNMGSFVYYFTTTFLPLII